MSYLEALTRLARLQSNQAVRRSLAVSPLLNERSMPEMRAWLQRAGHSEADLARLRCVHVAGSKGKGTVCGYTSSLLQAWKRHEKKTDRVGLYTSPHVVSVRERIALDGQPLSQADFARYFFEVYNAIHHSRDGDIGPPAIDVVDEQVVETGRPQYMPNFFTFLTLMAFHVFLREGVTDAVVECGIGGEYDSTNILPPAAVSTAVITGISHEHSDLLGETLEEIAAHKSGIIKPGVAVVTSRGDAPSHAEDDGARSVVSSTWLHIGGGAAPLLDVTSDIFDDGGKGWDTPQPDATNKALAIAAALAHTGSDLGPPLLRNPPSWLTQDELRLQRASLRGRSETIHDGPAVWVVDGAHTDHSLRRVGEYFSGFVGPLNQRPVVIMFNQQDPSRQPEELVKGLVMNLKNTITAVVCTPNDIAPPEEGQVRDLSIQRRARGAFHQAGCDPDRIHVIDNVTAAVEHARSYVDSKAAHDSPAAYILVTGSFHLAGSVLRVIRGEDEEL